jgi:hypothetical protein
MLVLGGGFYGVVSFKLGELYVVVLVVSYIQHSRQSTFDNKSTVTGFFFESWPTVDSRWIFFFESTVSSFKKNVNFSDRPRIRRNFFIFRGHFPILYEFFHFGFSHWNARGGERACPAEGSEGVIHLFKPVRPVVGFWDGFAPSTLRWLVLCRRDGVVW